MALPTVVASKRAKRLVASKRKELATLDDEFIGEVIGVAQAIDLLRKALNEVSACLDRREFEKASALGYEKIAEEFVFLQRTLGGLQSACLHKEKLVSDLAVELRCSYEEILPEVEVLMVSARPLNRKQSGPNRGRRSLVRAASETIPQKIRTRVETGTGRPRRRGGLK